MKCPPKRRLTRIYGIAFMANEDEQKKVNNALRKHGSELFYMPRKFRMNIYFFDFSEATKVTKQLNLEQDGKQYHIFPTSIESLECVKNVFINNKSLQNEKPTLYHKLTGYRLYNTADEYFRNRKNTKKENEK